jgi:hypothetical protein
MVDLSAEGPLLPRFGSLSGYKQHLVSLEIGPDLP